MVNRTFSALISAIAFVVPSVAVAAPKDVEQLATDYCIYDSSVLDGGVLKTAIDASTVNVAITVNGQDPLGNSAIEEGTTYQVSYDYLIDINPLLDIMNSPECFDLPTSILHFTVSNTGANLPGFSLVSPVTVPHFAPLASFGPSGVQTFTNTFSITAEDLDGILSQYYEGTFDFLVEIDDVDLKPTQNVDGLINFNASNP